MIIPSPWAVVSQADNDTEHHPFTRCTWVLDEGGREGGKEGVRSLFQKHLDSWLCTAFCEELFAHKFNYQNTYYSFQKKKRKKKT